MHIQFSYKNVDPRDKKFLEDYLDKKINRLENLMSADDFANSNLEIRVEKFVKKEAFKVEIHLGAPQEKILAFEDDHTVAEAFDLALDKLVIRLRKTKDKR
ncbi:MAG: HPF/RaiA family ribosome-associated protein [Patescibacteria group bacterium]|nr:HPF/RaiA family ribosome-associated protein [Patescibacteria group bacterium]